MFKPWIYFAGSPKHTRIASVLYYLCKNVLKLVYLLCVVGISLLVVFSMCRSDNRFNCICYLQRWQSLWALITMYCGGITTTLLIIDNSNYHNANQSNNPNGAVGAHVVRMLLLTRICNDADSAVIIFSLGIKICFDDSDCANRD